jgi:arginase
MTFPHNQAQPVLLGIPFDAHSSYLRGAALAPPLIRTALNCDSSNSWSENGVDLSRSDIFFDTGDLDLPSDASAFPLIEQAVEGLLSKNLRPVSLGGDHSITYPIVRTFARHHRDLTIVHFDAHPDLYDEFQGNRYSHACPFARIMEEGCAKRLIQLGIRTMSGPLRKQVEKFGVEVFTMSRLPAYEKLKINGPIYISFDMDVLDPAFAPGISHREPGGMSVREALSPCKLSREISLVRI